MGNEGVFHWPREASIFSPARKSWRRSAIGLPTRMSSKLSVKLLRGPYELQEIAPECARLAEAMRPRVPFATTAWLQNWWRRYRQQRPQVGDHFYVHAVRGEGGELVALAPLMLTERPNVGPLRTRCITFFGGDKNVTELRGLICAPEHEGAAAAALLAHLLARAGEWDWFLWEGLRQDGEASALLGSHPSFSWRQEVNDYVLQLPSASWDEFRASRNRNIKESLRKCYNSLKRDGHSFEFRVVSSASELPEALSCLFALHARRASYTDGADHADYLRTEAPRGLLRDLAREPDQAPGLRVFQLVIGGRVIASRLGFLLGDELYLHFSGFEPEWGRYSVMTTVVAEVLKWALARGLSCVNLSSGTDVSKTRWSPDVVTTCNGVLVSPALRGRVTWRLWQELIARSRSGVLARLLDMARRPD